MTRWTYGFVRAAVTAPAAAAAFFFLAMQLPSLGRGRGSWASIPAPDHKSLGLLQGRAQHVADLADPDEPRPLAQVLGDVLHVGLVERRRDDRLDVVALRRQRLLLQAADRQHLAGEGDLTGHRDVLADGAPGDQRGQRGGHRDAGARPVLGRRARRHVDVQVVVGEPRAVQAWRHLVGVRLDPGQRRLRRLLHDVAELAGEQQLAAARRRAGLDEQHVAADRRPRQARRHAGRGGPPACLGVHARAAEQLAHHVGRHRRLGRLERAVGRLRLGDLAGDLAADRPDLALQRAHARLARVVGDDAAQRLVADRDPRLLEAVALDLARHEVALGDLQLLVLGVAGELDDLHAVAQRPGHPVEVVGRADEHDLAQVERHVEVVVAEARVLLGIEHLEHRAGRIATEVRAHLVDLVDHEQRVVGARVAQRADDRARHGADVGPPVAADLGLVAHAADADALEVAAQRAGDGAPQRGLADAGRPGEAEDRAARVALEPAHGQELEDAVLDLLDVVVVGVEHLARVREVEVVLGAHAPRQRGDPLQVAADDAVLGRLGGQLLEAVQLALGLLAHVVGQRDLVELVAQVAGLFGGLVELPELLLDGLELLAQHVLALALVDLRLDLGLDLGADRDPLELARQRLGQAPQPAADVDLLQQRLLLLQRQAQRAGDEMAERARVVDVGNRELQLLGQVGHLLDDPAERLLDVARQRGQLGRLVHDVGQLADLGDEVGRLADPVGELDALGALDQDAQRPVGDLEHPRDRADDADVVELLGAGRLELGVARGDHDQQAVAGEHVVDEPDGALLADGQRRQRVGERDGLAQRKHGQHGGHAPARPHLDRPATALGADLDHAGDCTPRAPAAGRRLAPGPYRRVGSLRGAGRRHARRRRSMSQVRCVAVSAVVVCTALLGARPASASAATPPFGLSTLTCVAKNGFTTRPGDEVSCRLTVMLSDGFAARVTADVARTPGLVYDPADADNLNGTLDGAVPPRIHYGEGVLGFFAAAFPKTVSMVFDIATDGSAAPGDLIQPVATISTVADGPVATIAANVLRVTPPPASLRPSTLTCDDVNGEQLRPGDTLACTLLLRDEPAHEDAEGFLVTAPIPGGTAWAPGGNDTTRSPTQILWAPAALPSLIAAGATGPPITFNLVVGDVAGGTKLLPYANASFSSAESHALGSQAILGAQLIVAPGPAVLSPSGLSCADADGAPLYAGDALRCTLTVADAPGRQAVEAINARAPAPPATTLADAPGEAAITFPPAAFGTIVAGDRRSVGYGLRVAADAAPGTAIAPQATVHGRSVETGEDVAVDLAAPRLVVAARPPVAGASVAPAAAAPPPPQGAGQKPAPAGGRRRREGRGQDADRGGELAHLRLAPRRDRQRAPAQGPALEVGDGRVRQEVRQGQEGARRAGQEGVLPRAAGLPGPAQGAAEGLDRRRHDARQEGAQHPHLQLVREEEVGLQLGVGHVDRHLARSRLGAHERQLDAQDPVAVGGAGLVGDDVGAERDHAAKRPEVDLQLLVDAALGVGRAAVAGDDQPAALDPQPDLVGVDARQLGVDDRARRIAFVEDVDRRREAAAVARPQDAAAEDVPEELVHLAAHPLE